MYYYEYDQSSEYFEIQTPKLRPSCSKPQGEVLCCSGIQFKVMGVKFFESYQVISLSAYQYLFPFD